MRGQKPFSLLEINLISIIIITLGLMLIPTYRNFTAAAKLTLAKANCQTATRYLGSELGKRLLDPESASEHLIADLNQDQVKNPYSPNGHSAAFGAVLKPGVVRINPDNLRAAQPGALFTVECEWTGDNQADGIYKFHVQ